MSGRVHPLFGVADVSRATISFLNLLDFCRLRRTNRQVQQVCDDESMWEAVARSSLLLPVAAAAVNDWKSLVLNTVRTNAVLVEAVVASPFPAFSWSEESLSDLDDIRQAIGESKTRVELQAMLGVYPGPLGCFDAKSIAQDVARDIDEILAIKMSLFPSESLDAPLDGDALAQVVDEFEKKCNTGRARCPGGDDIYWTAADFVNKSVDLRTNKIPDGTTTQAWIEGEVQAGNLQVYNLCFWLEHQEAADPETHAGRLQLYRQFGHHCGDSVASVIGQQVRVTEEEVGPTCQVVVSIRLLASTHKRPTGLFRKQTDFWREAPMRQLALLGPFREVMRIMRFKPPKTFAEERLLSENPGETQKGEKRGIAAKVKRLFSSRRQQQETRATASITLRWRRLAQQFHIETLKRFGVPVNFKEGSAVFMPKPLQAEGDEDLEPEEVAAKLLRHTLVRRVGFSQKGPTHCCLLTFASPPPIFLLPFVTRMRDMPESDTSALAQDSRRQGLVSSEAAETEEKGSDDDSDWEF